MLSKNKGQEKHICVLKKNIRCKKGTIRRTRIKPFIPKWSLLLLEKSYGEKHKDVGTGGSK
jgi:hypothetical protein